ncbi:MAG: opine metallophore biosynthesis dehydrogenase [Treponema sp.]|jgi:hypothetical protein|nr:opine metallophore biosynthesis dehydrogenase [Treponema sp.]
MPKAVYIRYTSLLIDPFSIPDKNGRYFDFSAIPIQKVYHDQEGYWHVPRIPKEEYYRLKLLQGIAYKAYIPTPTIDKFIENYEKKLHWFDKIHGGYLLSDDFIAQDFSNEITIICDKAEIKGIKKYDKAVHKNNMTESIKCRGYGIIPITMKLSCFYFYFHKLIITYFFTDDIFPFISFSFYSN